MDRIAIVGMGLIGSSLGMALKKADVGMEIVGTDRDRSVAARAQRGRGHRTARRTTPPRSHPRRQDCDTCHPDRRHTRSAAALWP